MKIRNAAGTLLDAEFSVDESTWPHATFDVVIESRSGRRDGPTARNPDYFMALREILATIADVRGEILNIDVDSQKMRERPREERRLKLTFPIPLHAESDIEQIRLEITSGQRPVGQSSGARGGNNHKRIRLSIRASEECPSAEAARTRFRQRHSDAACANHPDEVPTGQRYVEGSVTTVTVNRYERDPKARQACIAHYGAVCAVCSFDFAETYGDIGAGYIQVHHLRELSSIGAAYEVDPVTDLRPVCPNCHAMLHQSRPAHSIHWLQEALNARRLADQ